ncbi:MAG TPA: flagellar basal body rod protein FlgB [Thermoleophilaceae bacterium]|jgi:flagellar basal-body rod protein FlgB
MSLFDNTDLMLNAAIRGSGLRQTALAQNVANANTPGYQRKDVDFESALSAAMADGQNPDTLQFGVQTDASAPMQPDGNSVDIDTESSKLAENGLDYESLITVAKGRFDILKSAMGG